MTLTALAVAALSGCSGVSLGLSGLGPYDAGGGIGASGGGDAHAPDSGSDPGHGGARDGATLDDGGVDDAADDAIPPAMQDDGGDDAASGVDSGPPDGSPPPLVDAGPPRVVFVTSDVWEGDLGGATGANANCQSEADNEGLAGTFKAWISDGVSSPATSFTQSEAPYVLPDGTLLAANWTELTQTGPRVPIQMMAGQTTVGNSPYSTVWTNTDPGGTTHLASASLGVSTDCSGFTTSSGDINHYQGVVGNALSAAEWSDYGSPITVYSCDSPQRLYCFQQ